MRKLQQAKTLDAVERDTLYSIKNQYTKLLTIYKNNEQEIKTYEKISLFVIVKLYIKYLRMDYVLKHSLSFLYAK